MLVSILHNTVHWDLFLCLLFQIGTSNCPKSSQMSVPDSYTFHRPMYCNVRALGTRTNRVTVRMTRVLERRSDTGRNALFSFTYTSASKCFSQISLFLIPKCIKKIISAPHRHEMFCFVLLCNNQGRNSSLPKPPLIKPKTQYINSTAHQ